MTREELIADLDAAAAQFAAQILSQNEETTGVPKPPKIEVTESQLDPTKFRFDLTHDPRSETEDQGGGGGGQPPPPEPPGGPPPPSPECPGATGILRCDSVAASKTKCGYSFSGPRKFLTKTRSFNWDATLVACDCVDGIPTNPPCFYGGYTNTGSGQRVDTFDPDTCTDLCTGASGGATYEESIHNDQHPGCPAPTPCSDSPTPYCVTNPSAECEGCTSLVLWISQLGWTTSCGIGFYFCLCGLTNYSVVTGITTQSESWTTTGTIPLHGSATTVLSNEYTTDLLKQKALEALPAFDGDFNDSCSASYTLSPDESSVSIQRFKYKFTDISVTEECLLTWWEVERDENGALVNAIPRAFIVTPAITETPVYTVNEPDTSGHTITISLTVPV